MRTPSSSTSTRTTARSITDGASQTINNVKTHGTVIDERRGDRPRGRHADHLRVDAGRRPRRPARPPATRSTSRSPTPTAATAGFVAPQGPGDAATSRSSRPTRSARPSTGTVTVNVLANKPPVITDGREPDAQQHQDQQCRCSSTAPRPTPTTRRRAPNQIADATRGRRSTRAVTRSTPSTRARDALEPDRSPTRRSPRRPTRPPSTSRSP